MKLREQKLRKLIREEIQQTDIMRIMKSAFEATKKNKDNIALNYFKKEFRKLESIDSSQWSEYIEDILGDYGYEVDFKTLKVTATKSELKEIIREEIQSLTENLRWDVTTNEPFDDGKEKGKAARFQIKRKPITIDKVEGKIDNAHSDVEIYFSNGDSIFFTQRGYTRALVKTNDGRGIDVTKYLRKKPGASGTVVGDLCLIYQYIFKTKLK